MTTKDGKDCSTTPKTKRPLAMQAAQNTHYKPKNPMLLLENP
jgi:hypothetical protein